MWKRIKRKGDSFCNHKCECNFNYNVGRMAGETEAYSKIMKEVIEVIEKTPDLNKNMKDYLIWCIKYDRNEKNIPSAF